MEVRVEGWRFDDQWERVSFILIVLTCQSAKLIDVRVEGMSFIKQLATMNGIEAAVPSHQSHLINS